LLLVPPWLGATPTAQRIRVGVDSAGDSSTIGDSSLCGVGRTDEPCCNLFVKIGLGIKSCIKSTLRMLGGRDRVSVPSALMVVLRTTSQ
jgi:hypothetical protein